MNLLQVNRDDFGDAVVVRAKGDIDSSNVEELISHLTSAVKLVGAGPARPIIIDLQDVSFFGSAGLHAVLDCHEQGLEAGMAVRVVVDSAVVARPIEVTNMNTVLDLYPTLPDALRGDDDG
jgi:anti-anti-sigma factor